MIKNHRIKKIICSALKILINSSIDAIQKKIESGHAIKQVSLYSRIYEKIKRSEFVEGYMWMGVVTIPASRYYLSDLPRLLLRRAK